MIQPTPEQEQTILKVIDRIAPKYTFGYYDTDDIKQESYIICVEALKKYDQSRPFENFISKHLANRLKTLIRDKYCRSSARSEKHKYLNNTKKNLVDLTDITNHNISYEVDFLERLSTKEALDKVMQELSPQMRNNFLRLSNDVAISSSKKRALFNRVKEILHEDW